MSQHPSFCLIGSGRACCYRSQTRNQAKQKRHAPTSVEHRWSFMRVFLIGCLQRVN